MVVSGEFNNGREEGDGGQGVYEKLSVEGEEVKYTLIWATQGSKSAKMMAKRQQRSFADPVT